MRKHVRDDVLEEPGEGRSIFGDRGEAWELALDLAHDRHAERVEGADGEVLRRGASHARRHAVFHFVAGVAREGQQQEVGGGMVPGVDEPCGLGDDDRRLPAAGGGEDEVVLLVGDDGGALFGGERLGLDLVEEGAGSSEFLADVARVGGGALGLGVCEKGL